jgi:hypothetical protein
MDTETPIYTAQPQLPQVRRVSKLDDIKRVIPPKRDALPTIKIPHEKRRSSLVVFSIVGVLFLGIFGFELAIIYKYDKLNKKLYDISANWKDRAKILQDRVEYLSRNKEILGKSRKILQDNYLLLNLKNRSLQSKMTVEKNNYENLLAKKMDFIGKLEGDIRVANAQVEAKKAQNDLLSSQLIEKNNYIEKLTAKLVNAINEQAALLNENIKIKARCDQLIQFLSEKSAQEKKPGDNENVNK